MCSICGFEVQLMDEEIITEKAQGFACYPMCCECFNNDAKPITYGKNKVHSGRKRENISSKMNINEMEKKKDVIEIKYNSTSQQKMIIKEEKDTEEVKSSLCLLN